MDHIEITLKAQILTQRVWAKAYDSAFLFGFFFNVYLFLRDRERQRMSRGGTERERERDTESEGSSRLRDVSTEPDTGLKPMNHEIMT